MNALQPVVEEEATRVPTFYGADISSYTSARPWIIAFLVSIIFGVAYLAGNFSPFPTSTERNVWLVSSSAISLIPYIFGVMPTLLGNVTGL
jgi:hypothetical protein